MSDELLLSAIIAALFAAVHVAGGRLAFLTATPRSVWLSFAGGVAVAYVFVHLLPELAAYQDTVGARVQRGGGLLAAIEHHIYVVALVGLASFYGLDRLARQATRRARQGGERRPSAGVFWIHLSSFAAYNLLIGYLLLHREAADLRGLLIYAVAMGLHFVVNDQALREHHGRAYHAIGRWLLAAAPLAGWALGAATTITPAAVATLFAFLAGGVVLNVLKEELPEERESRFSAFAAGSLAYAALLLASG